MKNKVAEQCCYVAGGGRIGQTLCNSIIPRYSGTCVKGSKRRKPPRDPSNLRAILLKTHSSVAIKACDGVGVGAVFALREFTTE